MMIDRRLLRLHKNCIVSLHSTDDEDKGCINMPFRPETLICYVMDPLLLALCSSCSDAYLFLVDTFNTLHALKLAFWAVFCL